MSNKVVPDIYRAVVDEVIGASRAEFEEYGVDESVLHLLQAKWENKILASRVADFPKAMPPAPAPPQLPHYPSYVPPPSGRVQTQSIKPEPIDPRFGLAALPQPSYKMPALRGPTLPANLAFPSALPGPAHPQAQVQHQQQPQQRVPSLPTHGLYRINQVDGPAGSEEEEDDDEDDYDEVPASGPRAPPRPAHPSVSVPAPVPAQAKPAADPEHDPEAINSDLDDSDEDDDAAEAEDAAPGSHGADMDIVFCTYDKVARVKNKWKCVLKDGMIHTKGKDYLFARCTGCVAVPFPLPIFFSFAWIGR
ncbi:Transcriptional factor IIA alpha/beta subunit [Mycena kentingensis (nom. inval.)]|nr:Transcriptional factor IIA alpha/beta subunit [Mycena kentingensis (nom. inval.)]